ncbi:MAG: hypothetical protein M0036_24555 [Desulfobacteraceae bacterium]|nr:hypothetical protein [Desulfobacteraceae bacterium]
MNNRLKYLFMVGCVLALAGCLEVTPKTSTLTLQSGQSQAFTAQSNLKAAEIIWKLDGAAVASGQAYSYFAANNGATPVTHVLVVKEQLTGTILPGDSATWTIQDLPAPTPTPVPGVPTSVQATDMDSGRTDIQVTWEAVPGADYYNIYRAVWEEDAAYELVGNASSNSFVFAQNWDTDVYSQIGDMPAMAPKADCTARAAFAKELESYRERALPYLFNFKAPAFFKVQACNAQGCSALSAADAGQAEFVHTSDFSEVAQIVIPLWSYPALKALADVPLANYIIVNSWCGVDVCGPGGGIFMARLNMQSQSPQADIYYENYNDAWELHPAAKFQVQGYIGGIQIVNALCLCITRTQLSGESDVSMGALDAHLFTWVQLGNWGNYDNEGYATITYKGQAYQFSIPMQPRTGEMAADPPAPITPFRDDAQYTVSRLNTPYPIPFAEQPPSSGCQHCLPGAPAEVICNRILGSQP